MGSNPVGRTIFPFASRKERLFLGSNSPMAAVEAQASPEGGGNEPPAGGGESRHPKGVGNPVACTIFFNDLALPRGELFFLMLPSCYRFRQ